MSIKTLENLRKNSGASDLKIADLMGISLEQYGMLRLGDAAFSRLYAHALDKASLLLALEQRNINLCRPIFLKQILKIGGLALFDVGNEVSVESKAQLSANNQLDTAYE